MEGFYGTEMCVRCKGECCRIQSGHCLPSDFGSADSVRAGVESGKYCIILLHDTNITARVVRPHYKDPVKKTGCIFQMENGCELSWKDRPYGCRILRPRDREGERCEPRGILIEEAAQMWEQCGYLPPLWKSLNLNYKLYQK